MKIGDIEIKRTAALAPMAGVADSAFRQVCKEFGAAYMLSLIHILLFVMIVLLSVSLE